VEQVPATSSPTRIVSRPSPRIPRDRSSSRSPRQPATKSRRHPRATRGVSERPPLEVMDGPREPQQDPPPSPPGWCAATGARATPDPGAAWDWTFQRGIGPVTVALESQCGCEPTSAPRSHQGEDSPRRSGLAYLPGGGHVPMGANRRHRARRVSTSIRPVRGCRAPYMVCPPCRARCSDTVPRRRPQHAGDSRGSAVDVA
jgi:hypothetical protein